MVAHKQVETSSEVDSSAERLAVLFAASGGGDSQSWLSRDAWYCESLTLGVGPRPDHAKVVIPCNSDDEAANMVAFDPTGPAKDIKIGTYCVISKAWTTTTGASMSTVVFVGKVQLIEYDRDADQLVVDVVDGRADLREIYIVGRYVYVPVDDEGNPGATTYQQGWPAHFNPGGRPNCIFDSDTDQPEFAPYPDYGLAGNEEPDQSAADYSRASYWTLGRILTYLRNHYGPDAAAVTQWPLLPKAPAWLVWPLQMGEAIDQEDSTNFDSGLGQGNQSTGGARKGREVILEGYGLLESLDMLLSIAGGYSLAVTPRSKEGSGGAVEFQNTLSVAKTRYTGGGLSIPYAASGAPTGAAAITGGTFIEDGEDFITSILGRSQLCFVERRFSTHDDSNTLKPAWTSAREDEFLAAIIDLGNTEQAYREACTLYPEVFTTWIVDPRYDFLAGTPWSGYPRANLPRTPWPTQHSYMTDEIGSRDYAGLRWPVYVEINTSGSTWVRGPIFDGLEIFDTGVIHIPALRDLGAAVKIFAGTDGGSSSVPFTEDESGQAQIAVRDIRTNLAIPCDHGVSWSVAAPGTDYGDNANVEVYEGNPDQARVATTHTRRKYVDLQQLYAAIYRVGSYYKPESCGGTESAAEYVRNDLDLLKAHVRRLVYEENRLRKGGRPRIDGHLVTYALGQAIKQFTATGKKPFPVNAQLTGLRLTSSGGDNPHTSTELLFGH